MALAEYTALGASYQRYKYIYSTYLKYSPLSLEVSSKIFEYDRLRNKGNFAYHYCHFTVRIILWLVFHVV